MFDRATKEVYDLMKTDTFPRFLKSPICSQLRRRLLRRHTNFTTLFDPEAIALIDNPNGNLKRKQSRLGSFLRKSASVRKVRSPRRSSDSLSSNDSTASTSSSPSESSSSNYSGTLRLKRWKSRKSSSRLPKAVDLEEKS